jgi:hypothetical protein
MIGTFENSKLINKMNASIDIDLLAHLGDFKNVDLLQRGKYCIQVGLYYGDQRIKIIPVGIFSAPSSTNSFVGDQRVSVGTFMKFSCVIILLR